MADLTFAPGSEKLRMKSSGVVADLHYEPVEERGALGKKEELKDGSSTVYARLLEGWPMVCWPIAGSAWGHKPGRTLAELKANIADAYRLITEQERVSVVSGQYQSTMVGISL